MGSRLVACLALGSLLLVGGPAQAQRMGTREILRNGWTFSLNTGMAWARRDGKPLMVVLRCVP